MRLVIIAWIVSASALACTTSRGLSYEGVSAPVEAAPVHRPEQQAGVACARAALAEASSEHLSRIDSRLPSLPADASERTFLSLEQLGWSIMDVAQASADERLYRTAEHVSDCMLAVDSRHQGARLLRGHALASQHRFKDAERLARSLVETRGSPEDYGLLGDALIEQGDFGSAVDAYQRLMDMKPGPAAYARASHVRWLLGDIDGAIGLLERAGFASTSMAPGAAAWGRVQLAELYFERNDRARGDVDRARWLIEASLDVVPSFPHALLLRGQLHLDEGAPEAAYADFAQVARAFASVESVWAAIEAADLSGERARASELELDLADWGATEDPRTYALFLASRRKSLDLAGGLIALELERRRDPLTLGVAAWVAHARGDHAAASAYIEQARAHGTRDARISLHAAAIALAAGEREAAERTAREAQSLRHMLFPSEQRLLDQLTRRLGSSSSSSIPPSGDRE